MRFVRVLVPVPARRAVRSRLDARYVTRAGLRESVEKSRADLRKTREDLRKTREDLRQTQEELRASVQEGKGASQEIRKLGQEFKAERKKDAAHLQDMTNGLRQLEALVQEVTALRAEVRQLRQLKTAVTKAGEAAATGHQLALQTAEALDHVLQNEARVWQAVDGLTERTAATDQ
ncbi:hypothetical protein GCM10023193_60150 [Planotetraspora kaengkrachanensis]|uniref:Uncharacterized protein n=1 Tax=Planotetraspora kaengkrachanensis TaxID=575193 RepID=A0A8J3V738_9ACTN|nr:hypothetical protein Pka01_50970 [Planotetraspora kaengkrachanensis]